MPMGARRPKKYGPKKRLYSQVEYNSGPVAPPLWATGPARNRASTPKLPRMRGRLDGSRRVSPHARHRAWGARRPPTTCPPAVAQSRTCTHQSIAHSLAARIALLHRAALTRRAAAAAAKTTAASAAALAAPPRLATSGFRHARPVPTQRPPWSVRCARLRRRA